MRATVLCLLIGSVRAVGTPGVDDGLTPMMGDGGSLGPGRSGFANPGGSNFGPPIAENQDFGGANPFQQGPRPSFDYDTLGGFDGMGGGGPGGPLEPYLATLRGFWNPITRHHFIHSDPAVFLRNAGGVSGGSHRIISMQAFSMNQGMLRQMCPSLVQLQSLKRNGAQLLIANPMQAQMGRMNGWVPTAPAGMCSRTRACGAVLPMVSARRTNMNEDYIHFSSPQDMNQYLRTHNDYAPSGRGVICWVWP
ncbi:unnamed protein product, partial [Mesorhabditis spiculigera]